MSSRQCWRFAQLMCLTLVHTAAHVDAADQATLSTFDKPNGEVVFALSLSPPEQLASAKGHDVVVLFDTSASQTGLYRDDRVGCAQNDLE